MLETSLALPTMIYAVFRSHGPIFLIVILVLLVASCEPPADISPFSSSQSLLANPDYKKIVAGDYTILAPLANDTLLVQASMEILTAKSDRWLLLRNGFVLYRAGDANTKDTIRYRLRTASGSESSSFVALEIVDAQASLGCATGAFTDYDTTYSDVTTPIEILVLANDGFCGNLPSPASLHIAQAPTHGSASVVDGALLYMPPTNTSTYDTLIYGIQSPLDANVMDYAAVLVRVFQDSGCVINAAADSFALVYRGALLLNVIENDLIGCPKEVDWDSFEVSPQPAVGHLSIEFEQVKYTLEVPFEGIVQGEYTLCQKSGECFGAPFVLHVLPCPAFVANDDTPFFGEGQQVLFDINVLANDRFCPNEVSVFEILEPPTYGTAVLDPEALNIKTYTLNVPNATDSIETFTYRICDQDALCDTARVSFRIR